MANDIVNRHRGLRDGELTRRYHRRHERADLEPDDDHDGEWDVDDYWDPRFDATSLDFQLCRVWQDVLTLGFGRWIDVPDVPAVSGDAASPRPEVAGAEGGSADRIADALHDHLRVIASRVTLDAYLASAPVAAALDQIRVRGRRSPALFRWFEQRRGPGIMLLLLAPFWIRALDAWPAPDTQDIDAIGRSLIDHLLLAYGVPAALYHPWRATTVPSLKWTSWLLLVGRGASLPREAPRFGWRVSSKLLQYVQAAPPELAPSEALLWAEITRLGGTRTEIDRVCRHPGYLFDPTACAGAPELAFEDEGRPDADAPDPDRPRRFLQSTVEWLIRHSDELTDDACALILDWAVHRHTEDLARGLPERDRFSWRGRAPAPALAHAEQYRQMIDRGRWGVVRPVAWRSHGWDWEERAGEGVWTVRELTCSSQLAEESQAMHHCVGSYAYRCVEGRSSIFSGSFDGERRFTLELEPVRRQVIQCRGKYNRSCDPQELELVRRWLKDLASRAANPA